MLLASWFLVYFFKRLISFNAINLGSLEQRAAKLQAIKLWDWFDHEPSWIRADWIELGRDRAAVFFLRPPNLTASNFQALWCTGLVFTELKDLNVFKKYNKNQEANSILWVGFNLSKRPHSHRAYLVGDPYSFSKTVRSLALPHLKLYIIQRGYTLPKVVMYVCGFATPCQHWSD